MLVPGRVNESMFWTLYFNRVYLLLRSQLGSRRCEPDATQAFGPKVLDCRWEHMLALKNRLVRDVAYACCCLPLISIDGNHPPAAQKTLGSPLMVSKKYSSETFWPLSVVNACFAWLATIDESPSELKKLKHWFAS